MAAAAEVHIKTLNLIKNTTYTITANMGYKLEDIQVTGRKYTDPESLRKITDAGYGQALFSISLKDIHEKTQKLPWVESATISRALPNIIKINLIERTPIALWQNDGTLSVIDADGKSIKASDLESFTTLPVITGDNAPKHAKTLLDLLKAEPIIAENLESAIRIGDRRWDLKMTHGLRIKLPEDDVAFALARIADAEREFLIFSKEILSLDARFSDKLIIKTSPGAASKISDHLAAALQNDTISVSD